MRRRKRQFKRSNPMSAMSEINITSLLDLSFCLLIIFMISTPLIEANNPTQQISIQLPSESEKPQTPNKEIEYATISIDITSQVNWQGSPIQTHAFSENLLNQSDLYWENEPVNQDSLYQKLQNAARQRKQPVLTIRADKAVPYQKVITVLDIARSLGLTQISLETTQQ